MALRLQAEQLLGAIARLEDPAPIPKAAWYQARETGSGLGYRFAKGGLAEGRYLTADMLADGRSIIVFELALQEGPRGPRFTLVFCALNQCQLRIRMPLNAVDQNRWLLGREGAWVKVMCGGDRVDLAHVDRMTLAVMRKVEGPVHFCLTDFQARRDEPARLSDPILTQGHLLDALGQSTLHEWPEKSRSQKEVTARLQAQAAAAARQRLPEGFSRWGGDLSIRFEATGFFRTQHDGKRWWLVDPEGYAFWSSGMDCVRVDTEAAFAGLESALSWVPSLTGPYRAIYSDPNGPRRTINYLAANFLRAFGPREWYAQWAAIALGELRRLGFNTVGNWSDWEIAQRTGTPYVRPLHFAPKRTPMVFRDFPDVFAESFAEDAAEFAQQLQETAGDPALLGYFLMNEPTWGFAAQCPAEGMLVNTPGCETRKLLARFLLQQHGSEGALAAAWGVKASLRTIEEGEWRLPLTDAARADLEAFSTAMVERLFSTLSEACRKVDPNHLNLGARYYTTPPAWALEGMKCFDAFSMNCYQEQVDPRFSEVSEKVGRPVLVGEWHFGALDVGLPASGIGRVEDQKARGKAFRVYVEDAAAQPWCVGVHYFTLYDQSALGRFDGECYNIGFLDVCNRPYDPICNAARAAHERLYQVARGEVLPYCDDPVYLPKLFA